jgi:carbonic anhydrase
LRNALALQWGTPTIPLDHPISSARTGLQEAQMIVRILVVTLLVFSGFSASSTSGTPQDKDKKAADECANQPFSYDHGASGQQNWCGRCNQSGELRQAPINISNTQESAQPAIVFNRYNEKTSLNVYPNPYNLKIDYKSSSNPVATITIGSNTFKLLEFHFHRPSEEAIDNRRFPMVLHLVHLKDEAGCEPGKPGCVAAIAILIREGTPSQQTTDLLNTLFSHFPPPTGRQNVQISLEGLLPLNYVNAGYWSYSGSLTTPPCTDNITFYVLKPMLTFSAAQIAEFERRYPSANARDIQPLDDRPIVNRH